MVWLGVRFLNKKIVASDWQKLVFIAAAVFWFCPHLTDFHVSYYRNESFVIPIVLLMPTLPDEAGLLSLLICVCLSFPMALLFFRDWLN